MICFMVNRRNMNKAILILVLLLVISCKDVKKANENYDNCFQIEIGMSIDDVILIMGEPDTILTETMEEASIYTMFYYPPPLASTGIDIYIDDETRTVVKVICSE